MRFFAALAVSIFVASPALAQPDEASAADVESARATFQQGLELRDRHDYPNAIDKLKAAYALVPTPRIAYELGKTYRMNGDLINARATFLEVERLPVKGRESPEAQKARSDSRAQAAELENKIPTLLIRVVGTGDAALTLDDENVSRESLAAARKVNPGNHKLVLQLQNRAPVTRTVHVREGEAKELEIKLPAPNTQGTGFETTSYEKTTTRGDPLHQLFLWTSVGGITIGAITGIYALASASDAASGCMPICPQKSIDEKNTANALAWTSNITFIIGVGAFITWLVIPPVEVSRGTTVGLSASPGFTGIGGKF